MKDAKTSRLEEIKIRMQSPRGLVFSLDPLT